MIAPEYPVSDPGADPDALGLWRTALERDGFVSLPGFLTPAGVAVLVEDARLAAPGTHHQDVTGTPYLESPDASWPEGHPRRHESRSALAAIAYDQFGPDSPTRHLYENDALRDFIGAILGRGTLYRYADPLGGLNVALMHEGDELGWHFDQTDFVVSIALQSSDSGGDFEVATGLRNDEDEYYEAVGRVLAGDASERVRTLPMVPGTLMLFMGRHSLHRVTPISGPRPRLVALLAYDTKPDTTSSELLRRVRYNRTEPRPWNPTAAMHR